MGADEDERLQAEIELLEAMYPDQVSYRARPREMKYTSPQGSFTLRMPSGYLTDELPEVLSASAAKEDARTQLQQRIQTLSPGEETLDSLIAMFVELTEQQASEAQETIRSERSKTSEASPQARLTVIIWLHHLLNTNKRKLALSPAAGVSGITKPGYPGVLIYSGPAKLVQDHVFELRQQNWQAFQVRLESDEEWRFSHGDGVKEVEAMKDVVSAVGEKRKEEFMEAMRMK